MKRICQRSPWAAVGCTALLALPAVAVAQSSTDAPPPLQVEWNARLRHEQVDDDAFQRDAMADTLRLRLGLRANLGAGWSGFVEGAGTASANDHYNSGANGQVQYPGVTDPHGTELNQAWLAWQGSEFGEKIGRQEIVLDNQRWIGNVGWRQFEQTFDAVALQWKPAEAWTLRYDWLDRVNRVAGPDALNPAARKRLLNTHLLNASWSQDGQQVTGYAYLHKDKDVATASTATYGARWTGRLDKEGGFSWAAEGARQVDYANNPIRLAHSYWLLEPAWTQWGATAKLGWEHLGGDGRTALQTPLATLHAFNGWDDQFTVTPANGLDDYYAALNGKFGRSGLASKLAWVVAYHDYHADHGGHHYGDEWNASLSFPVVTGLTGLLKVASYRADHYSHDDTKLWLQLEWQGKRPL
ncbi:MAG TPA: alginate export family protein [Dyella sp.]|uniref:alginate export family protein n=1 Tax=Dyella sp. TaxID=1869338 RepID=UPI002D7979E5|nr:alginate export family protein [Dyella sp.]HET6553591.1 alginate export family protein [Dyella sp.]